MDGSPEQAPAAADDHPPVPASDGARALARYGEALTVAVEAALGPWMAAAVAARLPADLAAGARAEADRQLAEATPRAVADIGGRLRQLLALEIDQQWTNPLSIIRQAVVHPTAVLAAAGVPPVERDATDARLNPDDVYGLVPLAFADLGPDVHERGLEWGAAKAHLHLTRRRAADSVDSAPAPVDTAPAPTPTPTPDAQAPAGVAAHVPNLFDRSRFDGRARFVETPDQAAAHHPALLIVDLDRCDDLEGFRITGPRVVGFGPHVDSALHQRAVAAGYDEVLPRSVFFHRLPELLTAAAGR